MRDTKAFACSNVIVEDPFGSEIEHKQRLIVGVGFAQEKICLCRASPLVPK